MSEIHKRRLENIRKLRRTIVRANITFGKELSDDAQYALHKAIVELGNDMNTLVRYLNDSRRAGE